MTASGDASPKPDSESWPGASGRRTVDRSGRTSLPDAQESELWRPTVGAATLIGDLAALVVLRPPFVIVVAAVGALVGLATATVSRPRGLLRPARRPWARAVGTGTLWGLGGAAVGVAAIGLLCLFRVIGLLVLIALVATSPIARRRLRAGTVTTAERDGASGRVTSAYPLSDAELCRRWQVTYHRLHDPTFRFCFADLVAARQALLDELTRRDPDGVTRWIDSGALAASDPYPFLRVSGDGRTATTDESG